MKKLAFLCFVASCQSIPFKINEPLPKDLSPYFAPVASKDGGGILSISRAEKKSERVSLDYSVDAKDAMHLEFSDPLGRPVASLNIQGEKYSYEGKAVLSKHTLKIDPNGFFLLDDKNTGLKLGELAALLEYKLPSAWTELPRHVDRDGTNATAYLRDEDRQIELLFVGEANSTRKQLWEASIIRSFAFGLFEHRLEFKMNLKEQFLTFEHKDQIKIVWRRM